MSVQKSAADWNTNITDQEMLSKYQELKAVIKEMAPRKLMVNQLSEVVVIDSIQYELDYLHELIIGYGFPTLIKNIVTFADVIDEGNYVEVERVYAPFCKKIEEGAFEGCDKLVALYLPECEEIGSGAFAGCSSLDYVYLPKYQHADSNTFPDCDYLGRVNQSDPGFIWMDGEPLRGIRYSDPQYPNLFSGHQDEEMAGWTEYFADRERSNLQISDELLFKIYQAHKEEFEAQAAEMKSSSVNHERIGEEDLIVYDLNDHNEFICRGVTDEHPRTKCIKIFADVISSVDFDSYEGVEVIYAPFCKKLDECALWLCKSLRKVVLPMCTEIGECAFDGCSSLEEIYVPKCEKLGDKAFRDCKSLRKIDLTACTEIGNFTFEGCVSLKEIRLPQYGSAVWEYGEFDGEHFIYSGYSLKKSEKPKSIAVFADYIEEGDYDGIEEIYAPFNVRIKAGSFRNSKTLRKVSFLKCNCIEDDTFASCESLESVSFPECEEVGQGAFRNCKSLQVVELPKCEKIGGVGCRKEYCGRNTTIKFNSCKHGAFEGCASLETVELPMLQYAAHYLFDNCTGLKTVILPSCESIHFFSFYCCRSLRELDLPQCKSIDYTSFRGCQLEALQKVNLPNGALISDLFPDYGQINLCFQFQSFEGLGIKDTCRIEDRCYETLDEALAALEDYEEKDRIITLCSDIDVFLRINKDVPAFVLDLNGYELNARRLPGLFPGTGSDLSFSSAIVNSGRLTIEDSSKRKDGKITGGTGTLAKGKRVGGGVLNLGTLVLKNGSICDNEPRGTDQCYGGGVVNLGTFIMEGGGIIGNKVSVSGGGIWNNGTLEIKGGTICDNTAGTDGGGICNRKPGTLTVSGGDITGNHAGGQGNDICDDTV